LENVPQDVPTLFHIDKIQGMISRFSSEPFEVTLGFPVRDGQQYPVIVVPSGVKTPVATKSDLHTDHGLLIRVDEVYVRSLSANNTPSTTRATWKDWARIVENCFDNREADIGRFLRRHIGGLTPDHIRQFASAISGRSQPEVSTEDSLRGIFKKAKSDIIRQ
jgi:hypothetical protein